MKRKYNYLWILILILIFICQINIKAINEDNDWVGYGGNLTNSKVTKALTPINNNDINAINVNIPNVNSIKERIVYHNKIYMVVAFNDGGSLLEYNLNGTSTKRTLKLNEDSIGVVSNKLTAGDNKLFISIDGGKTMAIDLNSFTKLWETKLVKFKITLDNGKQKTIYGQSNSEPLYYDGYLYNSVVLNPSSNNEPSHGFFYAIDVNHGNINNNTIDYAWTYPSDNLDKGWGYYYSDSIIVNDSLIMANENGDVIIHSLKDNTVYDTYHMDGSNNNVRSTLVYDEATNYLYVATQKSKKLYRFKINNHSFDLKDLKIVSLKNEVSGGIGLGANNIYLSSGGQYGKGLMVYTKDLTLIANTNYNTQSIPLVSEGYSGKTYFYFIDYNTGKLIIGQDNNNNKSPIYYEFANANLKKYNYFSIISDNKGNLIVPTNGNSFMIISKPLINKLNQFDENVINNKEYDKYQSSYKLLNEIVSLDKKATNNEKEFIKEYYASAYMNYLKVLNDFNKINSYSYKSGKTTYYLKRNNNIYYVYKTSYQNGNVETIINYVYDKNKLNVSGLWQGTRKSSTYVITRNNNKIINKKVNNYYDSNLLLIKSKTMNLYKNKYITTYFNTKTYYSNKKIKTNNYYYKNNNNQYTSIKKYTYYSNGKVKSYDKFGYSKGKLARNLYYKYNSLGVLKSNKYGKAYSYDKIYKNNKIKSSHKYTYNAYGKKKKVY
ncbi:MAG: hypothetical protein LBR40_01800 [Bacilli bacterium]|jgi:hypothetical protein|nr:hypothetical protein [Bacilli bacterium]